MKKAELVLQIKIDGQIKGGKNNMIVLQNGLHIPSRQFKEWRDNAVLQISLQPQQTFSNPLLERCGVVQNDSLIKNLIFKTKEPNKETACVKIIVFELFEERSRYGKMWRVSPVAENLN